jgi:hypothetical protein
MENKRDGKQDLELCQKATPGPWEAEEKSHDGYISNWPNEKPQPTYLMQWSGDGWENSGYENGRNDARFIAESREALPHWIMRALLAEGMVSAVTNLIGLDNEDCLNRIREAVVVKLREEGIEID